MLTVKEVAQRTGAGVSTVNLWCRTGKLKGAEQVQSPVGSYWLIPEKSIEGIKPERTGRPPKEKPASKKSA